MELILALVVGISIGRLSSSLGNQNTKESCSDSYVLFDEGRTQRGNGHGGSSKPKPKIVHYGQSNK
jgi:hypothetical protein